MMFQVFSHIVVNKSLSTQISLGLLNHLFFTTWCLVYRFHGNKYIKELVTFYDIMFVCFENSLDSICLTNLYKRKIRRDKTALQYMSPAFFFLRTFFTRIFKTKRLNFFYKNLQINS